MNPSGNAGMELPPPVSEHLPPANLTETPEQSHEQLSVSPLEMASTSIPSQHLPPPPLDLPLSPLLHAAKDSASSDDAQTSNLAADDGDLIEKEWVNKAKVIVERTKEDPYKQSEELKLLKSDYLQKRYNKTLKQST